MSYRFIEYLEIDGEPINLFISQEAKAGDIRCFRIQAHREKCLDFFLYKGEYSRWQILNLSSPDFIVNKVSTPLIAAIEKRLFEEKTYLSPQ